METTATPDPATQLVDAHGRPARRRREEACPQCGAGRERRQASGGFGVPHPVCGRCGFEFTDEVWHG